MFNFIEWYLKTKGETWNNLIIHQIEGEVGPSANEGDADHLHLDSVHVPVEVREGLVSILCGIMGQRRVKYFYFKGKLRSF